MGLIESTAPDPYAGLGIFRPPSCEGSEAAQNVIDQKQASDTVAVCEKVKTFAAGRISSIVAFEQWLQVQRLPIDTNQATELEQSRVSEQNIQTAATNYQGDVSGWAGGIQQVRSIAAHGVQPPPQTILDRLVFPVMSADLAAYIAANKLG